MKQMYGTCICICGMLYFKLNAIDAMNSFWSTAIEHQIH